MTKRTRRQSPATDENTEPKTLDSNTNDEDQQPEPETKRYRLRSGRGAPMPAAVDTNTKKAKQTNDDGLKKPAVKKSAPKPFIEYKGAVEYYTEAADIEAACGKLL